MKNLKYYTSWKKTLVLSVICSKCKNEDEKIFKEEESIEILKVLGLISTLAFAFKITRPIIFSAVKEVSFPQSIIFPQSRKFSLIKEFFHSQRNFL